MSLYKKNLLVGLTVLGSLILLGWMILRFSDAPMQLFKTPQIPVRMSTAEAGGLSEGSTVSYLGVAIGHVTQVRRSPDQMSVIIDAVVDNDPPPPANVAGEIRTQLFGGGASINLVLVPVASATRPATRSTDEAEPATTTNAVAVVPVGYLHAGQKIDAKYVGVGLMPPELTDLAIDLTKTSAELRRMTMQVRESDLVPKVASAVDSLQVDLKKAGDVLDKVGSLVGDQQMREDIRQTLANFNQASRSAKEVGQNLTKLSQNANVRLDELAANGNKVLTTANQRIEDVSRQLGDRLEQLAGILREVDSSARKINGGKGTAGKLINDPVLYESLLDVSKELKLSIKSLNRLLEQWEQEGVPLKLK
jgi:ABC-type transporter Mla subunit MlaD